MPRIKIIARFIGCLFQILVCIFMAGCPNAINTESVATGDYFRSILEAELLGRYGVNCHSEFLPLAKITYISEDGLSKTAEFVLDGYDKQKRIGYKLVLKQDKEIWDESLLEGNLEVPDLNDIDMIQDAAVKNSFPIIFLTTYQYQDELDQGEIYNNKEEFIKTIDELVQKPEIKQWARDGLYNGAWIRESFEKSAMDSFSINFAHNNLPVATIQYGNDMNAVFQLDGFDPEIQIGYKFVSAEDEIKWETQIDQGNIEVPDLSMSDSIKQAALEYDFPILFVYIPEYWELRVVDIVNQELYDNINMNENLIKWLNGH